MWDFNESFQSALYDTEDAQEADHPEKYSVEERYALARAM